MAEQQQPASNDERAMRRAKRQAMLDAGTNPYPIASHVTAHVAQLVAEYAALEPGEIAADDATCTIAGRIRAYRGHGKLLFIDLEDVTGRVQLFCRVNGMSETAWNLAKELDVGDIIEATGVPTRTRRGEFSLMVSDVVLLSKSLRPLPEKFHGLSDREVRYRQRYVDLIMNPEVRETFVNRSRLISAIRHYMEERGYLEVETPILQETLGGANARPFTTHFNVLDQDCYLRIATELHLKRCIVGGMERVFEVGRQFRNEGMDLTHNPEFTSMEAYCAYGDLNTMKELSEGLFQACAAAVGKGDTLEYQGREVHLASPWRSAPMSELVSEVLGEELSIDTSVEHLREVLTANELEWEESWGAGKLIFELYDELVEKTLIDPTFVCDYPVEVSPLAKRRDDDPRLTDRFELVICGKEYANAFSELNDPVDQESRFAAQVAAKAAGDEEAMDYDYDYVRALEYGMPPAGGIGYGIDRMIMLFCDQPAIRDVLLFPHLRPERREQPKQVSVEDGKLDAGISRDAAFELLCKYNDDPFHVKHGETLEGLMRYYAEREDPANVEFWGLVGLLHDLDWEKWPDPVQHTVKTAELLAEVGANPALAHSIQTHNHAQNDELPAPEHVMEKWLYATDELSGLIQAAVRMRPSRSVLDFNVKSLRKKFKSKGFAAGCNREIISEGAELLGMELGELFASVIDAMKAIAPVGDIYAQPAGTADGAAAGGAGGAGAAGAANGAGDAGAAAGGAGGAASGGVGAGANGTGLAGAADGSVIPAEGIYVEPLFADQVDFATFSRSDFRVVKVKACEAVPKSKKLLQFTLDDGSGNDRVILSGIKQYYAPEELVGKTLVAILNLPPRKMMGIDSCGMLISALHIEDGKEALHLLMLDDAIPAGAKLR